MMVLRVNEWTIERPRRRRGSTKERRGGKRAARRGESLLIGVPGAVSLFSNNAKLLLVYWWGLLDKKRMAYNVQTEYIRARETITMLKLINT
jgi:hypothetical protein